MSSYGLVFPLHNCTLAKPLAVPIFHSSGRMLHRAALSFDTVHHEAEPTACVLPHAYTIAIIPCAMQLFVYLHQHLASPPKRYLDLWFRKWKRFCLSQVPQRYFCSIFQPFARLLPFPTVTLTSSAQAYSRGQTCLSQCRTPW